MATDVDEDEELIADHGDYPDDYEDENDAYMENEGEEEEDEVYASPVRADHGEAEPETHPQSGGRRAGRNGPRSSHSAEADGSSSSTPVRPRDWPKPDRDRDRSMRDSRDSKGRSSTTEKSSHRRPRGNLPNAPSFDGDKKKDPKCFRRWLSKVDSYIAIAEKIIGEDEIGLRLHAALTGDAQDYVEDIPAKVFGEKDGWRVLVRLMRDRFEETNMAKVGSAMKDFFQLQIASDKQHTMRDVAELMDKAVRRCKETGLEIPDPVLIYFYFQHVGASTERQANLLLRTNGEYDWKKLKQAIDLLYPNVVVRPQTGRPAYRGRGAHEVHHSSEWLTSWQIPDMADPQVAWEDWLYENDPIEAIAENTIQDAGDQPLPEELARDLVTCFQTHRENRQRLARAVQARGFYVKGKGKGKSKNRGKGSGKGSKDGGKSKSRGKGGKARGMSLEELKAVTACTECGQTGHWKDECPARKSHVTHHAEVHDDGDDGQEQADYDAHEPDYEWDDGTWEAWNEPSRTSLAAARQSSAPKVNAKPFTLWPSVEKSNDVPTAADLERIQLIKHKVVEPDRTVDKSEGPKKVAHTTTASAVSALHKNLLSDSFLDTSNSRTWSTVQQMINTGRPSATASSSSSVAAVNQYRQDLGGPNFDELGTVWSLLRDKKPGPDPDSLRKSLATTRNVEFFGNEPGGATSWTMSSTSPRSSMSLTRRTPTIEPGRLYLTIDTACESTVVGTVYLKYMLSTYRVLV